MGVAIASELMADLIAAAAATPAVEVCGLLLGTPDAVAAVIACANVDPDPARAFEIDPRALFAAHRRARAGGDAVIGCYHSHPRGQAIPSARDAAHAMGDGALWLIVADGAIRAWRTDRPGRFAEVPLRQTGVRG